MSQPLMFVNERERPALIVPIAILAFAFALLLLVCGAFSWAGSMSMRLGAQLLGSGLEIWGPIPYFLYSVSLIIAGWGLLRARNWARRCLIVIAAGGVVQTVPHISSAVIDQRWFAMCLDGLQILVRVAIASYLFREAEWFEK